MPVDLTVPQQEKLDNATVDELDRAVGDAASAVSTGGASVEGAALLASLEAEAFRIAGSVGPRGLPGSGTYVGSSGPTAIHGPSIFQHIPVEDAASLESAHSEGFGYGICPSPSPSLSPDHNKILMSTHGYGVQLDFVKSSHVSYHKPGSLNVNYDDLVLYLGLEHFRDSESMEPVFKTICEIEQRVMKALNQNSRWDKAVLNAIMVYDPIICTHVDFRRFFFKGMMDICMGNGDLQEVSLMELSIALNQYGIVHGSLKISFDPKIKDIIFDWYNNNSLPKKYFRPYMLSRLSYINTL
jgi:hypothetical protein